MLIRNLFPNDEMMIHVTGLVYRDLTERIACMTTFLKFILQLCMWVNIVL